ncbi:unnamed protein product [Prorocentrum cordatum]|uniref:Glycosyl transferase CAP10 domain-containing protein n=1 Tax=Prorocentrum cordatum TaxID=2364126 RepID=A0ABN9UZJ2_9DINO|nr:unnamed protein product [Polarella glacialis]
MGGRISKLLSLGGVLLQHEAGYYESVDALARPWEHYVPIAYDLSDLVAKVEWLQAHDDEARAIAARGQALALRRMRLEDRPPLLRVARSGGPRRLDGSRPPGGGWPPGGRAPGRGEVQERVPMSFPGASALRTSPSGSGRCRETASGCCSGCGAASGRC